MYYNNKYKYENIDYINHFLISNHIRIFKT